MDEPDGGGPTLTPQDVEALILAAGDRTPGALRDRALLSLLYWGPLRLAEALGLKPANVDVAAPALTVTAGRRRRLVTLDAVNTPYLHTWSAARDALILPPGAPFFCTLRGGPLDPSYVRAMLPRLASQVRLPQRVSALELRRSRIARLVEEGVSHAELQRRLGHTSRATTAQLLRRIGGLDGGAARTTHVVARAVERLEAVADDPHAPWMIVPEVARESALLTRGDMASVLRFTPTTDRAHVIGWWASEGAGSDLASPWPQMSVARDSVLGGLAEGSLLRVDEIAGHDDLSARWATSSGFSSAVAAPIRKGGSPWGAVVVLSCRPQPFGVGAEENLDSLLGDAGPSLIHVVDRLGPPGP